MESLGMTVTDPNAEVQPGKRLVLVPPKEILEPEADYGRNQQQQRDRSNRGLERGR